VRLGAAVAAVGVLAIAGIVLGVVALATKGGTAFHTKTITLKATTKKRVFFDAPIRIKGHPVRVKAWEVNYELSGDTTGELTSTCVPVLVNEVDCGGAFLLEDGDIQWVNTEDQEHRHAHAEGSIIGGSGAYAKAIGTVEIDWTNDSYVLHVLIPA
jgi:hypothetical protein